MVTSLVSLQNVLVIFSSIGRVFCSFNLSPFFFPTRQKCVKHKRDVSWGFEYRASVVYFDQRAHACPLVCMVEKGKRWKHSKIIKNFLRFSSCALHEPLVHMIIKVLLSSFLNVFHRFRPCKHAFAGQNTQQTSSLIQCVNGLFCLVMWHAEWLER